MTMGVQPAIVSALNEPRSAVGKPDKDFEAEIRVEQGVHLVRQLPNLIIGNWVGVAIEFLLTVDYTPPLRRLAWLWFVVITLPMIINWLKLRNKPRPVSISRRRIRVVGWHSLVFGISWAATMPLFLPGLPEVNQACFVFGIIVLCTGAVASFSPLPYAAMAYFAPMMAVAVWVTSASGYGNMHYQPLALLSGFMCIALFGFLRQNWLTFRHNVTVAVERAQLADEVRVLNQGLEAKVQGQVEELERVGRLRRFLAPQLAQAIVSAGDETVLENHRREVVALFCDLRGFTSFSETAEPEDIMAVLAEYHAALGPLIRKYEGTLDRFTGDGMLVFFNDPLPCPDAPQRAARLALEMRDAVSTLAPRWAGRGHRLGFGMGMAQGYATLGRIGFEDRFDYTAIGAVINLAARLCSAAENGQVLASGRLATAIAELVELEALGEREFRGMSRPVALCNLKSLRPQSIHRAVISLDPRTTRD
jgi:class 3 adenylate cyclase